jgi:hypothetical protein
MDFIIKFINGLMSNPVSATFSVIIVGYFIIALIGLYSPRSNRAIHALTNLAPTALTSLGILGTFTGIFLGLLDFDMSMINKSVPTLLEGLKVAFGTSIIGLAGALSFRLLRAMLPEKAHEEDQGQEVIQTLKRMVHAIEENQKITKFGFEAQITEFRNFSEHMSKAFSEAIIKELKAVIREFNEKISEQFGENFKQLNIAVGRLLEWQDKYRIHLEILQKSFDQALNGIQESERSIFAIEKSSSMIPKHMEKFNEVNTQLNQRLLDLHQGLSSIAEMRDKAENAFPEIANNIDKMTTIIGESVEKQAAVLEASTSQMTDSVNMAFEQLNSSVVQLDEAMQKEIENIVQAMAESLSGITQKFVSDYTPLLEQTWKIIEISERAKTTARQG